MITTGWWENRPGKPLSFNQQLRVFPAHLKINLSNDGCGWLSLVTSYTGAVIINHYSTTMNHYELSLIKVHYQPLRTNFHHHYEPLWTSCHLNQTPPWRLTSTVHRHLARSLELCSEAQRCSEHDQRKTAPSPSKTLCFWTLDAGTAFPTKEFGVVIRMGGVRMVDEDG